jgi:heme ABC exporter ATP-binding subunit CcmA
VSGAALAARGATKRFGRAAALQGVDLELAAGRCLAVLGPNGAGKSTLLRLFAGLSRPSSGEVQIDGHTATHRASRARVGYLGHATLLSPQLTVRENLVYAARLYAVSAPRERAEEQLATDGLGQLAERPAAALSRGQAQRVAIARAMIHRPALLLFDEPFTGLDRGAATRLAERLAGLREGGQTSVLVTHSLEPVRALADEALVLEGGRTAWRGGVDTDTEALEEALALALDREDRAA